MRRASSKIVNYSLKSREASLTRSITLSHVYHMSKFILRREKLAFLCLYDEFRNVTCLCFHYLLEGRVTDNAGIFKGSQPGDVVRRLRFKSPL